MDSHGNHSNSSSSTRGGEDDEEGLIGSHGNDDDDHDDGGVTFTNGLPNQSESQGEESPRQQQQIQLNTRRRLILGIAILILVDLIWVASAELTEYIFHSQHYNKPFFSTYLKTSLFLVFLSGFLFWSPWHEQILIECSPGSVHEHAYHLITSTSSQLRQNGSPHGNDDELVDNNYNSSSPLSPPTYIPLDNNQSGNETDESSNQRSVRFSKTAEVRQLSESEANEALYARLSYNASLQAELLAKRLSSRLSLVETARLSLTFCILWFIGAYTYQLSISFTEAAIVNLLSSSSSFFTLVLAAVYPSNQGDAFTWSKLLGVVGSFGGVMIVTLSDAQLEEKSVPLGAVFALISALAYASYLVFLRRRVVSEERLDIVMFFGFVGLFNLLLLWPLFFLLHYTSIEQFEWPTHKQWIYLILNGVIGTVFAEVLWLWGAFLTSSLIATLAVGLTIPISLFADVYFKNLHYSLLVYLGAFPMVACFVAVSLLSHYSNWDPVGEGINCLKRGVFHPSRDLERYERLGGEEEEGELLMEEEEDAGEVAFPNTTAMAAADELL